MHFINADLGFIGNYPESGGQAKIFKTTNGGLTWDSNQVNFLFISSIHFINSSIGWFTGFSFSCKYSATSDGGLSWVCGNIPPGSDIDVRSIFFIDHLNGWIGSPYVQLGIRTIFRTTNGGSNWYAPSILTSNSSYSLFFSDINNGWSAGDQGLIYHTSNAGLNWTQQTPIVNNRIYRSIYFTDSLTGWCVGDSGRILKTTTGGILTNFTNTNSEIPTEYKLYQNYPNPFNPKTIINYELGITNFVSLKVYDALGSEVTTLVNEKKTAGSYEVEFDGSNLPSGIYFYRLEAGGDIIDTKRMVLLK